MQVWIKRGMHSPFPVLLSPPSRSSKSPLDCRNIVIPRNHALHFLENYFYKLYQKPSNPPTSKYCQLNWLTVWKLSWNYQLHQISYYPRQSFLWFQLIPNNWYSSFDKWAWVSLSAFEWCPMDRTIILSTETAIYRKFPNRNWLILFCIQLMSAQTEHTGRISMLKSNSFHNQMQMKFFHWFPQSSEQCFHCWTHRFLIHQKERRNCQTENIWNIKQRFLLFQSN